MGAGKGRGGGQSELGCLTTEVQRLAFCIKHFQRGLEAQDGAGSCVEAVGDAVEFFVT